MVYLEYHRLINDTDFPQDYVLSPTLCFLHINDMLEDSSIHCCPDDHTVDAVYFDHVCSFFFQNLNQCRNKLMSSVATPLGNVSLWGEKNLVQFNHWKIQVCTLTIKKNTICHIASLPKHSYSRA